MIKTPAARVTGAEAGSRGLLADPEDFFHPGRAGYEQVTHAYNPAARVAPAIATVVRSTEDVVRAVGHATRAGLPLRVMATGHGAAAKASMTWALLIQTDFAAPVRIDPVARTACIPAGTRWSTVVEAAAEHGLIAVHGSAGDVGVVGYLIRGGVSFYGRKLGLAANSILSITIVLASGETVTASDNDHRELFWALRGGGGGFGIVTEIQISLFPMTAVITGATMWSAKHAAALASCWGRWTRNAPREVSTSMRLLNLRLRPGAPAELRHEQVLVIDGAVAVESPGQQAAADAMAAELLAPLREIATPLADTWQTAGPAELLRTHLDPDSPMPYLGAHVLLDELGDEGIARFIDTVGPGSQTELTIAELRQLGGGFATPDRPGGALDRFDARFAHLSIGVTGPGRTRDDVHTDLDRLSTAIAPWSTGRTIPTAVVSYDAVQRTFDDQTARRVSALRSRLDPQGMFRGDVECIRDEPDPFSAATEARVHEKIIGDRRHGLLPE